MKGLKDMNIYTKTGDKGMTSLFGGKRVKKYNGRVETYGTIDELNANLSLAAKKATSVQNKQLLEKVQYNMFYLAAEIATEEPEKRTGIRQITESDVSALEQYIDQTMKKLPAVKGFILPGQTESAAQLHVARTVARRAERLLIQLSEKVQVRPEVLKYANRLSDFLYAMAREEDNRQKLEQAVQMITDRYLEATGKIRHDGMESILFDWATQMAEWVFEESRRIRVPVTVALVDAAGQIIQTVRMPGSILASTVLAPKKAFTAVSLGIPTHELGKQVQPGQALYQLEVSLGGTVVSFGGGFPIELDGKIVGAIGVSGGTVEEDIQIAQYAVVKLKERWKDGNNQH